ncbi:MAG: 4Fe-4S dicluster domain-containing protein [Chloroflexota bacterium]|nr:4Fe-4S dicluster domain-containing protein [Chloroflexota bacterium]
MSVMEEQIREAARTYLESGEVSCVIGYERGPRGKVRPAFIYEADEVDRLVWSADCDLNLVTYVHNFKSSPRRGEPIPKVAVVARPCDARAVNLLVHEEQIKRENVKVIGVTCAGTEVQGESRLACQFCQERVPVTYDVLIESDQPLELPQAQDDYADIIEMENWTPQERLEYWFKEFDRCIRCYACRQACPGCYCFECVAEQVDPHWTSIALEVPEKYFFHVMRAFHLAGRCVGCDACQAACPMDIPLGKLNRKIAKEVEALFDYHTGDDPETAPPLATFNPEERLRL